MSRKVIVNGENICYLPPVDASEINYNNTTVKDAIDELTTTVNSKVSKSGDTMTGALAIEAENSGTSMVTSQITLGNNIATGTEGNSAGAIALFADNQYCSYMVARNLTADRVVYFPDKAGTVAMTSDLDIQSLTFSAPAFSDTSKIKVTRTGKIIKISFSGCTLSTAIGQYGILMTGLPINTTGYSVGVFFDQNDNDKQVSFYINDNQTVIQTNNALPVGAKIWGSFIYFG